MKCDHCEKTATVNYQDVCVAWDLTEPRETREPEIISVMDDDNIFLCEDHDTPENR